MTARPFKRATRRVRGGITIVAWLALQACASAGPDVNRRAAMLQEFQRRIAAYLEIQKKAASDVPPPKETDSPALISGRERALGDKIRQLRTAARAGDVFAPVQTLLVSVVREDWRHRSPADRQALLQEVPIGSVVSVNSRYPPELPLATVAPTLLARLPPLPEGLEYRFVSRHLIMRDVKANLVVDMLRDVLPPAAARTEE